MADQKDDVLSIEGKTRILIVDDHDVVVQGIKRVFEEEPDFEIVGTAGDGLQALAMVRSLTPDIVILDISMPGLNGIEALQAIRASGFQPRIVIYSMYSDKEYVFTLFKAGISAYILKSESVGDLLLGVKAVSEGGTYFSRPVHEVVQKQMQKSFSEDAETDKKPKDGFSRLSTRERELFILFADGWTPKQIAEQLHISPKTVESHKYNIMEKLEADSVAQFTKIAMKRDLIRL